MNTPPTRVSLLVRLRDETDVAAWGEFESRYGDLVVRYACARGFQHCDAEDVRQIVFSKLFRRFRAFEYSPDRGRFRDYLRAAVRNAMCQWHSCPERRARSVDPVVLAETDAVEASDADALWEQEWENHHFRQALAALAEVVEPRSLTVFRQLLDGRSAEETAVAEGMTVEAVRKVRQRLRARLTELVREQVRDEDGGDCSHA